MCIRDRHYPSGRVKSILINQKQYSGREVREKVFTNEYHKKNTTLYETGIKKHMYNYIADFYSQTSNNITYII